MALHPRIPIGLIPINKQTLIDEYLYGLDLTDDDDNPYPQALWDNAVRTAATVIETKLDARVFDRGRPIVEPHDFTESRWNAWQLVELDCGPLRDVTKINYVYGGRRPGGRGKKAQRIVTVPDGWVHVMDETVNQIRIVPNTGTIGAAFAQLLGPVPTWPVGTGAIDDVVPGFIEVHYMAGFYCGKTTAAIPVAQTSYMPVDNYELEGYFDVTLDQASGDPNTTVTIVGTDMDSEEKDVTDAIIIGATAVKATSRRRFSEITSITLTNPGSAQTWTLSAEHGIPDDILHAVKMVASMFALNPAGDLLVGAGIANVSIGVDGLHESIGTTSSATNAGFGARIIQYTKDLNALVPEIRSRYRASLRLSVA